LIFFTPGIGDACGYNATTTIVQQLFTHNRGLANGVLALGFALGGIVHPLYVTPLMDRFGLFGLLLIQGGLSLNILVFAYALKPEVSASSDTVTGNNVPRGTHFVVKEHNESQIQLKQNDRKEHPTNTNNASDDQHESDTHTRAKCTQMQNCCRDILDFSPLTNISYTLCTMHFFLLWMSRLGMTSHLVSAARLQGVSHDKSAFLNSILATGTMVTRLLLVILMNFHWMNPVLLSGFAALSTSIGGFLVAYFTSYDVFALSAVLVGIGDGE
jgi:hypothetical protein